MLFHKPFVLFGLISNACAQAIVGASENSAAILEALRVADNTTIISGRAAKTYRAGDKESTIALMNINTRLQRDFYSIQKLALSSPGLYSNAGAQAIIEYVDRHLYPDTKTAHTIYAEHRDEFAKGRVVQLVSPAVMLARGAFGGLSAAIQAKTRAALLTPMAEAFIRIEQSYADMQELQQYGPPENELSFAKRVHSSQSFSFATDADAFEPAADE